MVPVGAVVPAVPFVTTVWPLAASDSWPSPCPCEPSPCPCACPDEWFVLASVPAVVLAIVLGDAVAVAAVGTSSGWGVGGGGVGGGGMIKWGGER